MIDKIKKWVENFVSVHNSDLGTIPCPYAKQAILNDTIEYKEFSNSGISSLGHQLYELVNGGWNDTNEVLVLYADASTMTQYELSAIITQFNNTCVNIDMDLVALEDHPDDVELINDVAMNFGKGILVLIQRASKLDRASEILKKQGYYNNWSQENLDDVVNWRKRA